MITYAKAQDNVVGVVTSLWAGPSGVRIAAEARDFSFLLSPNQLWGPSTLLFNGRGCEVHSSASFSAKVKNKMNRTPLCLHGAVFHNILYLCWSSVTNMNHTYS